MVEQPIQIQQEMLSFKPLVIQTRVVDTVLQTVLDSSLQIIASKQADNVTS